MLLPNEQKLIFDCGFENEMSGREIHDIVHGLVKSFAKNRDHRAPFTMHLCNINTNVSELALLPQSGLLDSSYVLQKLFFHFSGFPVEKSIAIFAKEEANADFPARCRLYRYFHKNEACCSDE